jgi:transcriptional regulator with GAF, ATPase, and Fis domain
VEPCGEGYEAVAVKPSVARLNGRKLKSAVLRPGDRIELGELVMVFDSGALARDIDPPSVDNFDHTFTRFASAVGRERDLRALLGKVISILFEVIGGTDAFIFTLDENGKPRVFVSSASDRDAAEVRFSDTVVQEALTRGEGVFIPNALDDPAFSGSRSILDLQLSSVLCCPLRVAGKTSGVIYLGSKKASTSFSRRDLDMLNVYATVVAMLINHVEYISQQHTIIRRLARCEEHEGIIAESKVMRDLLANIEPLAASDIPVLLEGDTGTGKDLFAHLIHQKSRRADKAMVVVNCSSLHGELMESELFGHRKGSFTGAVRDHEGLFVAANGGTLFLDEIGEMEAGLQAKLLRTLETGTVRAVGATEERGVDVRIICATNRKLADMVERGTFRKDLYYRINQYRLILPPLCEREDDCVLLAYYFLEQYRSSYPSKEVIDFHPDTIKAIVTHDWPGNIRELAGAVHKGVLSARGPLVTIDLGMADQTPRTYESAMREFQRRVLRDAVRACGGNKEKAAKRLGLSRSTFFRYLAAADASTE